MPIVSKAERSQYLEKNEPILSKLCVANELPTILSYRCNTQLPFCYGATEESSSIPAEWDSPNLRVIPLWEGGSSVTAIAVKDEETKYIQINYENPNDVEFIATSSRGLFLYLFYFLVESLDEDDEEEQKEIQQLASYVEFDKLDLVFRSVGQMAVESDYSTLLELTRSL
jgi:hypothetical protein